LANSAVAAAEDVRKAVRVSRTASNAKAAASAAAFAAQNVCETGDFASIDEARAAQTRASIAQSHAIHAAVVDHEAKSVKKRAALALANDVKCWNIHRKRETLQSCVAYARSQHEATRRAVDAWSTLRDGFIGTAVIPSALDRKHTVPSVERYVEPNVPRQQLVVDPDEVTVTIYEKSGTEGKCDAQPTIVAVEHHILSNAATEQVQEVKPVEDTEPESILPFATAAPIPEEEEDEETEDVFANDVHNKDDGYMSQEWFPREEGSGKDEVMSASMQSLVDGLMSWGGVFDSHEDHFALPAGMAASIVMEESSMMGPNLV
jgi:hypothetical protein